MEYYILIGIILGIAAAVVLFIHRKEVKSTTLAGNIVLVITHILEAALVASVVTMLWAPALVVVTVVGLMALVAG